MPPVTHHVVFSYKRGIFLGFIAGEATWSKDEGISEKALAMTFDNQRDLDRYLDTVNGGKRDWPKDAELREVHPTGMDEKATIEDCSNVGLPRWGKNAAPEVPK